MQASLKESKQLRGVSPSGTQSYHSPARQCSIKTLKSAGQTQLLSFLRVSRFFLTPFLPTKCQVYAFPLRQECTATTTHPEPQYLRALLPTENLPTIRMMHLAHSQTKCTEVTPRHWHQEHPRDSQHSHSLRWSAVPPPFPVAATHPAVPGSCRESTKADNDALVVP